MFCVYRYVLTHALDTPLFLETLTLLPILQVKKTVTWMICFGCLVQVSLVYQDLGEIS